LANQRKIIYARLVPFPMAEDKGRNRIGHDSFLSDLSAYRSDCDFTEQGLAVVADCSLHRRLSVFLRDHFRFRLGHEDHPFLASRWTRKMAIKSTRAVFEPRPVLAPSDPLPCSRYPLALLLASGSQVYPP